MFSRRKRHITRLLIVEDEPLVAFDNEHFLRAAGYDVVATVDSVAAATQAIQGNPLDLVLADLRLSAGGTGVDVARAAQARGVPVLFVAGDCPDEARALAIGWLPKPYGERGLLAAIEAVDATLGGRPPKKLTAGLVLFDHLPPASPAG